MKKKAAAKKAVRKQAKKQAKCETCKGRGFIPTPSAISPGRFFKVLCTACN